MTHFRIPGALLLVVLLAGCGATPEQRALYLPPPQALRDAPAPTVRVSLPRYVDHRSLRVRAADQRLRSLDAQSWAESPAEGFERLLAERLAASPALRADDRIELRLYRFERDADGVFRALGQWRVRRASETRFSGALAFERRIRAANGDAEATPPVSAMSAAVAATAEAIIARAADD